MKIRKAERACNEAVRLLVGRDDCLTTPEKATIKTSIGMVTRVRSHLEFKDAEVIRPEMELALELGAKKAGMRFTKRATVEIDVTSPNQETIAKLNSRHSQLE